MSREMHYSLGLESRDRVNNAFGGGIPKGSIVLMEGPDGNGKSAVSQRIAYGTMEEGSVVTYVSTELGGASNFIEQMNDLDYDVTDHLLKENLLYLKADMDTHRHVGGKSEGERQLLKQLMRAETMWKSDVVVLDEFGAMLRNDPTFDEATANQDEDHMMQTLITYLNDITATQKTVVLTVNPEEVTDRAIRPIRDVADIYLQMQSQQVGSDIRKNIAVKRFAGQKNPVDDSIGFSVEEGRGMSIESRTVA